jgi:hypothetical protein
MKRPHSSGQWHPSGILGLLSCSEGTPFVPASFGAEPKSYICVDLPAASTGEFYCSTCLGSHSYCNLDCSLCERVVKSVHTHKPSLLDPARHQQDQFHGIDGRQSPEQGQGHPSPSCCGRHRSGDSDSAIPIGASLRKRSILQLPLLCPAAASESSPLTET